VLAWRDDQGAEIHRAHDVIHHPVRGLVDDASRQSWANEKAIRSASATGQSCEISIHLSIIIEGVTTNLTT